MRSNPTRRLALGLLLWLGCSGPAAIELTERWPEKPRSYETTARAWTRGGDINQNYQLVARVHATFLSPELRAAEIEYRTELERLSPGQRQKLVESEQKAAAGDYVVELFLATHEPRENDLNKGKRSIWRLTLADDRGNDVEAVDIKRDRRPHEVLRSLYPWISAFDRAYIVRFPRTVDVLHQGAREFTLRAACPRGSVVLTWNAAR